MEWLKKHFFKIIYLYIFLYILFLVASFFIIFATVRSKIGTILYEEIISNLPIINYCNKIYKLSCKISGDVPSTVIPQNSTLMFDILKMLIASPAIMLVRRFIYTKIPFVSDFLTRVPTAKFEANIQKEANATGAVSISPTLKERLIVQEKEKYYKSIGYKLKTGIVNICISLGTLFFTVTVLEKYKEFILNFLSTKTGSLAGVISIVIFFLLYCLIFKIIDKQTFSFAIMKTIVFNIIPSMLSTFITGALVYCCYMFLAVNKNKGMFLLFWVLLFFWCEIQGQLEHELRVIAVKYRDNYDFKLSTVVFALCIYPSYIIAAQFYKTDIDALMQYKYVQMFCNIKSLPFYEYIISGTKIFNKVDLADTAFKVESLKMCFLALFVCIVSKLLKNMRVDFSKRGWIKWSFKISIECCLFFVLYSFLIYVTKCNIKIMLLLLIAYTVAALVINCILGKNGSTVPSKYFILTNILLESLLVIVGEMILIYVAESVADKNFLYLSVSYSACNTIYDVLTEEFITRMLFISCMATILYVCEALDLGVKNKST